MKRESVHGGWVDFREPEDVPERLRRRVTTMSNQAAKIASRLEQDQLSEVSENDMKFLLEFNDAIAICLVMGWSWDMEVSVDGLLDLPASVYDFIVRHGQANVNRLLPNFQVDPDPKVISENSNE